MTTATYREIIAEGIEGLPVEALAEIADFVLFMRRRSLQPEAFADENHRTLLLTELKNLSRGEEAHLDEEWDDYEQRYPLE